jgi:hypothetical protein
MAVKPYLAASEISSDSSPRNLPQVPAALKTRTINVAIIDAPIRVGLVGLRIASVTPKL